MTHTEPFNVHTDPDAMDENDVRRWYEAYIAAFSALYDGDVEDVRRTIPAYWGVPLVFSRDDGTTMLTDEAQVVAFAQEQLDALRSEGVADLSDLVAAETTVLNRCCALHRAQFSRRRADTGDVIRREFTYLITDGPAGRRISAIAVHSAT